jgi:hypothetical protein
LDERIAAMAKDCALKKTAPLLRDGVSTLVDAAISATLGSEALAAYTVTRASAWSFARNLGWRI